MTKTVRWLLALLACVLLVLPFAIFKTFEIRSAIAMAESFPEHSETVTPTVATKVDYQPVMQVMGEVVMPGQVVIRNELPARVTTVEVEPGELVKKGQLLFQLDISDELASKKAAKARLELVELKLRRIKELRKTNAASQSQQDELVAERKIVQSELAVLNSTMSKNTLRAPFDGQMGLFTLEQGSYLEANTEIGMFSGNQPWVWVEFSVPQFYPVLDVNTDVKVQPTVSGYKTIDAQVVARDTVIATTTRTNKYRARIEGRSSGLTHNEAVKVIAPNGLERTLYSVPLEAVQTDGYGAFVYLLASGNDSSNNDNNRAVRAERRPVVVFKNEGQQALISEGLKGGERLAAKGAFKLYPGVLVNLANPQGGE